MTRRTRRLLLFAFPATMVAGIVVAWLLWPRTAITRENAAKIHEGMTLAEVEAILGGPARNETTGPTRADGEARVGWRDSLWIPSYTWQSDAVLIFVWVDSKGGVVNAFVYPRRRVRESPLHVLRRLLRL